MYAEAVPGRRRSRREINRRGCEFRATGNLEAQLKKPFIFAGVAKQNEPSSTN
jgi:hypothetical protein